MGKMPTHHTNFFLVKDLVRVDELMQVIPSVISHELWGDQCAYCIAIIYHTNTLQSWLAEFPFHVENFFTKKITFVLS